MNHKIAIPPDVRLKLNNDEGLIEQYRIFCVAQLIQQLLVDYGATQEDAHRILGFTAAKTAEQMMEPQAVAELGNAFMDAYGSMTERHFQQLQLLPEVQLRESVRKPWDKKIAASQAKHLAIAFNLSEEVFFAAKHTPKLEIVK